MTAFECVYVFVQGCNCNPGRCLANLGITPEEVRAAVEVQGLHAGLRRRV
jgi:hypothetical protein